MSHQKVDAFKLFQVGCGITFRSVKADFSIFSQLLLLNFVDEDESSDEEGDDDEKQKPKLDHHKHHPIKVYRNDSKNRFGQPMTNPILAEDVKGKIFFL